MAFSVVTNFASVNAQANLSATSLGLNKALNRLRTGKVHGAAVLLPG